jgi:twitching motility two-component system response regulator PilH
MTVKKVLCVEDSVTDLTYLQKIVADNNVLAVVATSGAEALTKAKAEKPDLIFMDINMAGMDGFATTRELKKDAATKAIPVVFVTSKGQKADKVWAQMQGGQGYVVKPYTAEQIVEQLRAF